MGFSPDFFFSFEGLVKVSYLSFFLTFTSVHVVCSPLDITFL